MFFSFVGLLIPLLWCIIFLSAMLMFAVMIVRNIREWHSNNQSPVLVIHAKIVSKRQKVSIHHNHQHMRRTKTSHYVTFQAETGSRVEFLVNGPEYGLLAEGDQGRLTFQGTRYLKFERMEAANPGSGSA